MTKNKEIEKLANEFCFGFLIELNNLKNTFSKFGMNLTSALPDVFKDGNLDIRFIFSEDREHVLIVYSALPSELQKDHSRLSIQFTKGNVFDPIGGAISFDGGSLVLNNCKLNNFQVGYGVAISLKEFLKRTSSIKQFASDFASSYWLASLANNTNDFLSYLTYLKAEMKKYFFSEDVSEFEIDKFIEQNNIIITRGLSLIKPMHQVKLDNILDKYEHDLKPDLIAFDENDKIWAIVDYKKAKNNILKKVGKVRTGLKAEVHSLKDQLRDYTEYFNEKDHRDFVQKKYHINIVHPKAIGIIGNVSKNEEIDFVRLLKDEPRWFNVIPYNYLYDRFCRYIEIVEGEFNKGHEYNG